MSSWRTFTICVPPCALLVVTIFDPSDSEPTKEAPSAEVMVTAGELSVISEDVEAAMLSPSSLLF